MCQIDAFLKRIGKRERRAFRDLVYGTRLGNYGKRHHLAKLDSE